MTLHQILSVIVSFVFFPAMFLAACAVIGVMGFRAVRQWNAIRRELRRLDGDSA